MQLQVFCFVDLKTGMFNVPFFMAHRGQAVRAAMDLGADRNTTIGRHPADFALCAIGTWDDSSAAFTSQNPLILGTVQSFLPDAQAGQLFETFNPAANGAEASEV